MIHLFNTYSINFPHIGTHGLQMNNHENMGDFVILCCEKCNFSMIFKQSYWD